MRKILLGIGIALMVTIFSFVLIKGINIGGINVLGVTQIKNESDKLKEKNDKLTKLAQSDLPSAVSATELSQKSLQKTKDEYESQILLNSESGTGYLATTEKYEIEFLWTKLGNYAKDNDVDMKIDLTNSSMGQGYYKLNFTAIGSYVGITDFIYSIENDSKLGFKIDNFVMTQNDESTSKSSNTTKANQTLVKATFSCDEVAINIKSIEQNTDTNTDTKNNTNTTNTTENNTTKSNTTNTASNTTNTTVNNNTTD